jgi:hypothetical protein
MFSNNSMCSGDGDEQLEDSGHVGFRGESRDASEIA